VHDLFHERSDTSASVFEASCVVLHLLLVGSYATKAHSTMSSMSNRQRTYSKVCPLLACSSLLEDLVKFQTRRRLDDACL
jgi:hypothetical protein